MDLNCPVIFFDRIFKHILTHDKLLIRFYNNYIRYFARLISHKKEKPDHVEDVGLSFYLYWGKHKSHFSPLTLRQLDLYSKVMFITHYTNLV